MLHSTVMHILDAVPLASLKNTTAPLRHHLLMWLEKHEECERHIIHRDVKACNIMLDAEFNAKLGDFGLAEVYEHSTTVMRAATIPAGTIGCLAPEYVYYGIPSVKTDVYSFGVVLLEVATGRRPVDDDGSVLVDRIWDHWEKGKLIEAADPMLVGLYNTTVSITMEVERMLMVGLSCVHLNHEKRPTVKEAARILRGEMQIPSLPQRKPAVGFQTILSDSDSDETQMNFAGDTSPCTDDVTWLNFDQDKAQEALPSTQQNLCVKR